MPRSKRLGAGAEDAAAEFIAALGYTVITRNFVAPGLSEIDIVAMDGDTLVFVEVKERRQNSLVGPEESVNLSKQRRLWAAANYYLGTVVQKEVDARFDVVAFCNGEMRHHIDAFRPNL